MLNYDFIIEKSKKERIDRVTIEREYWQLIFLQLLYQESYSEKIYFKGGTAIRFLYRSFRFSEDLDFTSILKKEETEKLLLKILDFLKNNANIDYKKEKILDKFEDLGFSYKLFFYPFNLKQKTSIRIDFSFREKPKTKEVKVIIPFDYPITPYPLVVSLSKEEILAEKIRALFYRGKPRDLFDLWFLLTKKTEIDEKLINLKFKYYPGLKFSFQKLVKIVEEYNEKELKKDLNQFLPEYYRHFYRQLKEETLNLLK